MPEEYTSETGERIIVGSRRPDGTFRKDVRVRAGYVPQEEQQVYQSKGALSRQGVPKVPGLDSEGIEVSKAVEKSKAAKKNEKRKQKKVDLTAPEPSISNVTSQLAAARLSGSTQSPISSGKPAQHSAEADEAPLSPVEKKIRALRKKLKQAEALIAKQHAGEALTGPEMEKANKAPAWRSEIRELEEDMQ